jgi:RNA polymerase sigma factor (sigma-70 family)
VDQSDAELFEKHADELTRFATGIAGPVDAPDIVSGAFLRCMLSERWPYVTNRRAYLYRAVLNEAIMAGRSVERRLHREQMASAPRAVGTDVPRPEVLEAVSRLSLRQRAVIVLTYWNDLEPASVAGLLGISEGAVRRHLARARGVLKEYLDEQD